MRETTKLTVMTGLMFTLLTAITLTHMGTDFRTMTLFLYLYPVTSLVGGFLGYRKARYRFRDGEDHPGLKELLGLEKLARPFKKERWRLLTEYLDLTVRELEVNDKLISVVREDRTKISYPVKTVEKLEKQESFL